jgi:hypothetical protein
LGINYLGVHPELVEGETANCDTASQQRGRGILKGAVSSNAHQERCGYFEQVCL